MGKRDRRNEEEWGKDGIKDGNRRKNNFIKEQAGVSGLDNKTLSK